MVESMARALLRDLAASGSLPEALPPGLAAPELVGTARDQGLCGLLLGAIEAHPTAWAEPLVPALAAERRRTLVRTLGQIDLAARVLARLAALGLRALPLKGVVLAGLVYDVESDRPMSDVDLLVLERWGEATRALQESGFSEVARGDHAWALRDPASGEIVELHRSVTSAPGLYPLDASGLWERRQEGAGPLPLRPAAEDLLVQLALHAAFQHGLVLTLVQWLDFRRLIERQPLDARLVLELADRARARVPLAAALRVATAVVGAPLPAPLRTAFDAALPPALGAWLAPRLARPLGFVSPEAPALARLRFGLLAGRRAELLWRTLVLPETPSGDTRLGARVAFAFGRGLRLVRRERAFAAPYASPPAPLPPPPAGTGGLEVPYAEDLLRECLSSYPHVQLTVSGHCMEPTLAHGEKVQLVAVSRRAARLGDVVLARQKDGLRLHRLVWGPPLAASGSWRTKADRGRLLDPPLAATDVLATIDAVLGRPGARPRRPARALVSLAAGVLARLGLTLRPGGAEAPS